MLFFLCLIILVHTLIVNLARLIMGLVLESFDAWQFTAAHEF